MLVSMLHDQLIVGFAWCNLCLCIKHAILSLHLLHINTQFVAMLMQLLAMPSATLQCTFCSDPPCLAHLPV